MLIFGRPGPICSLNGPLGTPLPLRSNYSQLHPWSETATRRSGGCGRWSLGVNLSLGSFSTEWSSIACVSTVSIVRAIRARVPGRLKDDLRRPHIHCR
jgi:hypothetical protein